MLFLISLLALATPFAAPAAPTSAKAPFAVWAKETLDGIDKNYRAEKRGLYLSHPGGNIDFAWGAGVQLSALTAAAKEDPKRLTPMKSFIKSMDAYWHADKSGLFGYDATANNRNFDRYYDDNVWIALALVEAYEVTKDRRYLQRAKETMTFVQSGADDQLGGGIWWRETERKTKHACSTGPALVALLRIHQHDPKPADLKQAEAWYAWMNDKLQDPADGLYYDCIAVDGKINKTKWTYNTALMIRANLLLAKIERKEADKYNTEALRVATAAKKKWVDPETGALKDGGRFAHMMAEAFVEVSDQTKDTEWRRVAERAVVYAHDHTRNAKGFYGEYWHKPADETKTAELIAQSSAARAFARLAQD